TARAKRQKEAGDRIVRYLDEDIATGVYRPNETMYRVANHAEPPDHTEKLNQMLGALDGGWLREEVEPGLHYIVSDNISEDPEHLMKDLLKNFSFAPHRPIRVYAINELKKADYGYYPFPLTIRDPKMLLRFYRGEYIIFVAFDLEVIEEALHKEGFTMETPEISSDIRVHRINGPWVLRVTEE